MAKLSVYQKAERALRLLIGLRNPRIAAVMKGHGFGDRDLAEGWALLRRLGVDSIDHVPPPPPRDPLGRLSRGLDAWENRWFPIVAATLARRVPEGHAWLFHNLSQASGSGALVSVTTFLDRYDRLAAPKAEGGLGALGEGVKALLAERGLNEDAMAPARALVKEFREPDFDTPVPDREAERAALAEAEAALWAWCLEWGAVARASIHERDLLRQLGFLKVGAGGDEGRGRRSGAAAEDQAAGQPTEASEQRVSEKAGSRPKRPTRRRARRQAGQ